MEEVRKEKATEILFALLPGPKGVRELCQAVGGSPNTVLLRVEELKRAGFIVEQESETWPYKKMLYLTDRGRRMAEMIRLQYFLFGKNEVNEEELKERGKWILSILHVMGDSLEGSTRLQKLLFLLRKEFGVETPYRHLPFHHGPFSVEVYGDMMDLERMGWIEVVRELAEPVLISLTDKGKEIAKKIFDSLSAEEKQALLKLRKYGQMPLKELLNYVYSTYPEDSKVFS